jgi:[ribosomal protein S5]-alanine N-acetyltransferase
VESTPEKHFSHLSATVHRRSRAYRGTDRRCLSHGCLTIILIEPLRTARLSLEPLTVEHADTLFAGLSDDRICEFIEEQQPRSVEQLRQRYAGLSSLRSPDGTQYWLNWAVHSSEAQCYVGYVQATVSMNGDASVGYIIFPPMWGRGYATEAVQAMLQFLRARYSTRKFSAFVDPRNTRSARLLERLGFVRAERQGDAVPDTNDVLYQRLG